MFSICLMIPALAFSQSLSLKTNKQLRQAFLDAVRSDAIETSAGIASELEAHFPGVNTPEIPDGVYAFESDVIDLILKPMNQRNFEALGNKWGYSEAESFDIALYYGTQVFAQDQIGLTDPGAVFSRIRQLARTRFINQNREMYEYLSRNVTRLSVPEMAAALGTTQLAIYSWLGKFGISIRTSFNRYPMESEIADWNKSIRDLGYPSRQLSGEGILDQLEALQSNVSDEALVSLSSKVFGFGNQALKFILHYEGAKSRGVSWNRSALVDGQHLTEVELLSKFYDAGQDFAQIARALNSMFPSSNPDQFRTEMSVLSKIEELGLNVEKQSVLDIYDSEYGYLKVQGRLVDIAVLQLLVDNPDKSDQWLADRLSIGSDLIHAFRYRHGLDKPISFEARARRNYLERYKQQTHALRLALEWTRTHSEPPTPVVIAGLLSMTRDRVFASNRDWPGVFDNAADYYVKLKNLGQLMGVRVPLTRVKFAVITDELKAVLREDLIESALEWISKNGQPESPSQIPGETRIDYVFPSYESFWVELWQRARVAGLKFSLVDMFVLRLDDKMREIMKEEALFRIAAWMEKHNFEHPKALDSKQWNEVGISYSKLVRSAQADAVYLFKDRDSYLIAIKNYLKKHKNFDFKLLSMRNKESTLEYRQVLQRESLDLMAEWVKDLAGGNGELPIPQIFKGSGIDIRWEKLVGSDTYAVGNQNHGGRIFDSREAMYEALENHLTAMGIAFRRPYFKAPPTRIEVTKDSLLQDGLEWIKKCQPSNILSFPKSKYIKRAFDSTDQFLTALWNLAREKKVSFSLISFSKAAGDGVRGCVRTEALEVVAAWMKLHQMRWPKQIDFSGPDGIPVPYGRMFSSTKESVPQANGIFSSYDEFAIAMKDHFSAAGVDVRLLDAITKNQSNEMRALIKKEVLTILTTWLRSSGSANDRLPTRSDFLSENSPIPNIKWDRLVGSGGYAPSQGGFNMRIFDSREELYSELRRSMTETCQDILQKGPKDGF